MGWRSPAIGLCCCHTLLLVVLKPINGPVPCAVRSLPCHHQLLVAICISPGGHGLTIQALDHLQRTTNEPRRFQNLVHRLTEEPVDPTFQVSWIFFFAVAVRERGGMRACICSIHAWPELAQPLYWCCDHFGRHVMSNTSAISSLQGNLNNF